MVSVVALVWFSTYQFSQTAANFQRAALYRDETRQFIINGNFKPDLNHRLTANKISSLLLDDKFDCTFKCVNKNTCKSFNLATNADSNGLYLCELLDTDKYRASGNDLQVNTAFHHFSPWSPCRRGEVGIQCERNAKSCSELKDYSPQATSGSYVIDPDGVGGYEPFTAFCNMTAKNGVGVTVIGHDSEARMYVKGYDSYGSYVRHVHYLGAGVTGIPQIAGITDVSTNCEQFIKFECYHARLFVPTGSPFGWWMSRHNSKMTYWGGATPADSYKCACGVTSPNTCAEPSHGCNCDINDNAWRQDSGLLTEKSDLPVIALHFGDTGGSSEKGYHTLGKFKCYGMP